ncbi:hypothetical protein OH76DRAFT_1417384 [Lentinus brumalis]|uniref:Uncharacterized protein n=1 Tax=Lentinus brumalis TaxID=2498619 RepID=A0A371DFQ6_9APHY|nr:hypothetical protein OH76DRAFT_1417384 [Polyporus brumalis]
MSSDLIKRLFKTLTFVAVVAANGQTTFKCKAFQATLDFNMKFTITPARVNDSKVTSTSRGNAIFPLVYRPGLFNKYTKGTFDPTHQRVLITRPSVHQILRERGILVSVAPIKNPFLKK